MIAELSLGQKVQAQTKKNGGSSKAYIMSIAADFDTFEKRAISHIIVF